MKPEKQRIAIAETRGIIWKRAEDGWYDRISPNPAEVGLTYENVITSLPDYLNDLNAMHEAITSLSGDRRIIYLNILSEIVRWNGDEFSIEGYTAHTESLFLFCNATATQRAEAFLRAIGKWEEEST